MAKTDPRDAVIEELRARLDRLEGKGPGEPDPLKPGQFKKFPMMLYRHTDDESQPDHPGNESMTVTNDDELQVAVANGWSPTHRTNVTSPAHKKARVAPGDKKPGDGPIERQPARSDAEQAEADRIKAGKPASSTLGVKISRAQAREAARADRQAKRDAKKQAAIQAKADKKAAAAAKKAGTR